MVDLSDDGEEYTRSEETANGPAHSARFHSGHLCHDGLWADRRVPDRGVPGENPLYVILLAVPHRQWMVRRHAAADRLLPRRRNRKQICGPLLGHRRRADDLL